MRKIFLILGVVGILVGCREDNLSPKSVFSTRTPAKTAFDHWLDDNFVDPYNITIQYRFDDGEVPYTHDMVPAELSKSKKLAYIIKHMFVDPYNEVAKDGSRFLREYAPRVFTFVGDGDAARATAEAGMKVVCYYVNTITFDYAALQSTYFKTLHHEFLHIMNQRVAFPSEYALISDGLYLGANTRTNAYALSQGFASAYGMTMVGEDTAELYSWYVTRSPEQWAAMMTTAGSSGAAIIAQKLAIMKSYIQSNFGVDMDELRDATFRRMNEINILDMDNLPF